MAILRTVQPTFFKKAALQTSSLPPQDKVSVAVGQTLDVQYAFRVGNHCLVNLVRPLGTVGQLGYFFLPHVQVTLQELRAVWLTNVDSEVLNSRSNLQQALATLNALGFNTLYPVVWNRGFTLYPSSIAQEFTGASVMPNSSFENRDMLAELIEAAKPFNFRVIPWFEYGLKAPPNSPIAARNPHLITADVQGNEIKNDTVWLNPTHPEVQQFMIDLIADLVARYEVAGVQLDDNFGLPTELGYDSFTRALYRQTNQDQSMPLNPRDPVRVQWLTDQITGLFRRIFRVTKSRRDALISLSPNPLGFSRQNYAVDWQLWEREGLVEELVLQVYRSSLASFTAEIDKPEVTEARFHIPVAIGVLTGLRTQAVSFSSIREQVQTTRQKQFAGSSCFFYETLFYEQLSPQKVVRNASDLQTLFPANSATRGADLQKTTVPDASQDAPLQESMPDLIAGRIEAEVKPQSNWIVLISRFISSLLSSFISNLTSRR
ncbi:glycoside hydrolase family 10 protein [Leptolyngbya ohadii]|uniref:glycoside hydrolase family 10 protein n=1 Tax=Leptolyngbya ohadii TaxID=1962290 RepID=UPI000B59DFDD|nr:family 10 glycosylhydrolase [Leptolyngbya ohadii]